jgi:hypothetical protein
MAIFNGQVGAGVDDGYWFGAGFANNGFSDRIGNVSGNDATWFARIDNVTIEGTINTATLSVRAGGNYSNTVPVRIRGVLENDPATVASAADGNGRTLTYYDSPDISSIIQELIDAGYTYSGTQAIMLFMSNNGAASGVFRNIRSYDHDSVNSPAQLDIDYSSSNATPTIVPNTGDSTTFTTTTPSFEFTGSDAENDDLTYEIQISDNNTFPGNGSNVTDSLTDAGTGGIVHPNPDAVATTHEGEIQVDDRPGQGVSPWGNSILDKIRFRFGGDVDCAGSARVRVYNHAGVFGTSGTPENPASAANTPTLGWLATSEQVAVVDTDPVQWWDFNFTGANRIPLTAGQKYFIILDWLPNDRLYDNTITVQVNISLPHPGNAYIDGDSVNNGVNLTFDVMFELYEDITQIDAASNVNPGFLNTLNAGDLDPFTAGQRIRYTVQAGDALTDGKTYYWRARVQDPTGSGQWSSYTTTRQFDINTGGAPSSPDTISPPKVSVAVSVSL